MLSDDNVIDFFLHGDDKFRWQDESTMRFIKGSQRDDVFIYLFIYLSIYLFILIANDNKNDKQSLCLWCKIY